MISSIQHKGPFDLRKGEWTDDISMTLCFAQSLIERNGSILSIRSKLMFDGGEKGTLATLEHASTLV